MKASLGLDFGTESVRAVLVDLRGRELASAVANYAHGQIVGSLPGSKKKLPPHSALQHPLDWIESAAKATRAALRDAKVGADDVLGIGVDFTSCTMLPTRRDGAAILGALAAGAFASPREAIRAMAVPKSGTAPIFKPNRSHRSTYDSLYREYRRLGDFFSAKSNA